MSCFVSSDVRSRLFAAITSSIAAVTSSKEEEMIAV